MQGQQAGSYAPINVKPQGGGGGGEDPGEFDIVTRARVKFPTLGHLENVKFPPLGTAFCPKQIPDPRAEPECQNPHPGKSLPSQFPVGSPPLPSWGLTLVGALVRSLPAATRELTQQDGLKSQNNEKTVGRDCALPILCNIFLSFCHSESSNCPVA